MREVVSSILAFVLIIVLILFVVSLIKPKLALNKKILKTTSRKKLSIYYVIVIVVLFIGIAITAPPQKENKNNSVTNEQQSSEVKKEDQKSNEQALLSVPYKVVKVVDGDTIDVKIDGKTERLRLIGIDTPETVDPRKPVQCFGKEASNKAKELLDGKSVKLESDPSQGERDKYDRLLRYVFFEDGTSYNKLIISEGYAHEYTYNTPYKYQAEYKQAQKDAESSSKGLWSASTCAGDTEKSAQAESPLQTTAPVTQQPQTNNNCDPNYSPCVPNVSYDLDCGDISFSVTVIGTDKHRFDKDGDGHGCESN